MIFIFYIQHIKSTVFSVFFTSSNKFRVSLHLSLVKEMHTDVLMHWLLWILFCSLVIHHNYCMLQFFFPIFALKMNSSSIFTPSGFKGRGWDWTHCHGLYIGTFVLPQMAFQTFALLLLFEFKINAEGASRAHLCIYIFRLSC